LEASPHISEDLIVNECIKPTHDVPIVLVHREAAQYGGVKKFIEIMSVSP
jgi:hypothetical protein